MNHSTKKLKEELFQQHLKDIDFHSYYKDKQNPTLFDHNKDLIPRCDDKQAFVVKLSYNGNILSGDLNALKIVVEIRSYYMLQQ